MKKFFKIIGIILGLVVLVVIGFISFISIRGIPSYEANVPNIPQVTITPERIAKGEKLASMLCNECHYNPGTNKMTGREMNEVEAFGKIRSKNITQDPKIGIGAWTDAQIIYLIRTGIHPLTGKYVPPYMAKLAHISDEDLNSIIAYLHSDDPRLQPSDTELPDTEPSFLTKFLSTIAFKPFPFPDKPIADPDTTNAVEWGKYMANSQLECFSCHSNNFESNDYFEPEKSVGFFGGGNPMFQKDGTPILTPNITMDQETGIGSWSEEKFVKVLLSGSYADRVGVRYPMMPYSRLNENEAKAIFAYLKSIPPIKNKVERGL